MGSDSPFLTVPPFPLLNPLAVLSPNTNSCYHFKVFSLSATLTTTTRSVFPLHTHNLLSEKIGYHKSGLNRSLRQRSAMPPTDASHTSGSLQIPTMEYNTFVQPPFHGSSQARPISVAANTTASSSSVPRRQRASHNVVSPSSNAQQPERSQSVHDSLTPYTDVYSHPAAVAYAAAHPRRTIPKFGPYLLLQTLGEGEFGKVKLGLHCQWGEEVAVKLIRRGNVDSAVRMSKIEREIEVLKVYP